MFKLIFRWLIFFELILIGSTYALASTRSDDCDLPGLFGITPGTTTHDQAMQIIASLPADRRVAIYTSEFMLRDPKADYTANVSYFLARHPPATDLEFYTQDLTQPILTLGQFIDHGCQPSHVYRAVLAGADPTVLLLTFGQDNRLMVKVYASGSVNAASPIDWVWILPPQDSAEFVTLVRGYFSFKDEIAWQGYAPDQTYWAAAPLS